MKRTIGGSAYTSRHFVTKHSCQEAQYCLESDKYTWRLNVLQLQERYTLFTSRRVTSRCFTSRNPFHFRCGRTILFPQILNSIICLKHPQLLWKSVATYLIYRLYTQDVSTLPFQYICTPLPVVFSAPIMYSTYVVARFDVCSFVNAICSHITVSIAIV